MINCRPVLCFAHPPHRFSLPFKLFVNGSCYSPKDVQDAAKLLGYNKKLWDSDEEPDECDVYWKKLSPEQQEAATKLGYSQKAWDKS